MNRAKLKNYAPQARRDFIQAVTDRAAYYGLTPKKTEPIIEKGDVALIGGRAFPRDVAQKRKSLEERISRHGFEQVMETLAYTWFNRLVAIRFMELHGYLDHGYRVLSQPEGKATPEILEHAEHVDLPGIDRNKVIELKLEGTKEEELYRMLLIAQCNALHMAMPFLFEWINDETELLLPDNLLHSDSLVRKLVNEIDEGDWQEVEIIGWIYESYISEKKDEVIGKVVRSEDIPAATQRFTPNWIVKYLVQNSLGRQWLATYPNSPLRQQMAYYIEPAEQTLEVQAQLKAITPESLNPEEITFLDDACGSGHILVEAYDLFKLIYQERGYRAKDIPRLILKKNLYGLEIDDRAAQLAAFSVMMKARGDDRHIFEAHLQPNILAIQTSKGLDTEQIFLFLSDSVNTNNPRENSLAREPHLQQGFKPVEPFVRKDIDELIVLFEKGKTYGSLIRVSENLARKLPQMAQQVAEIDVNGDLFSRSIYSSLLMLLKQARFLSNKYSIVVTNPPYMGSGYFNSDLKSFVNSCYSSGKADIYGAFIQRNLDFCKENGFVGMITIPNWMFLSNFQDLRSSLMKSSTIYSLIHNGRGVWGPDFGSCSFILRNKPLENYNGIYRRLFNRQGEVPSQEELNDRYFTSKNYYYKIAEMRLIPGYPIAYWLSNNIKTVYLRSKPLSEYASIRQGLATGDNNRFLRLWSEVDFDRIGFSFFNREDALRDKKKWFPYNKGGRFRRWYGNHEWIVNWENDGAEIRHFGTEDGGRPKSRAQNVDTYFFESISWSKVTIGKFSVRCYPVGFIYDVAGCSIFTKNSKHYYFIAGMLNS